MIFAFIVACGLLGYMQMTEEDVLDDSEVHS